MLQAVWGGGEGACRERPDIAPSCGSHDAAVHLFTPENIQNDEQQLKTTKFYVPILWPLVVVMGVSVSPLLWTHAGPPEMVTSRGSAHAPDIIRETIFIISLLRKAFVFHLLK